jgi:hypothetical protein
MGTFYLNYLKKQALDGIHPEVYHCGKSSAPDRGHLLRRGQSAQHLHLSFILVAGMFLLLLQAATRLSATIDEGFHITSGYEYLRTGRMQLLDEHVPLAKALLAWPLFFVPDLMPPEQAEGYAEGNLIRVAQGTVLAYRPIDRVIVACRIPVALLTLVLAATVYRWAADRFGPGAGLLALTLFALDPNILAHGSLATTDLGATAFIFWAVWAFARYLERPRWREWWLAGLMLGLAQGAKLTAALLIPLLGIWGLVVAVRRAGHSPARALGRWSLFYGGMLLVAALTLWALYRFEVRPVTGFAAGIPLPAASHIERWLRLRENLAYGREAFLLGQNRMHGWWLYFPVAFALKTPLPTLLMIFLGLVSGMGRRKTGNSRWDLLLFPTVYGLFSLTSTINIGYRHLLPVLPFLFVLAGRSGAEADSQAKACATSQAKACATLQAKACATSQAKARATSQAEACATYRHVSRFTYYLLLSWLALGTLRVSPHYLAFFNELAGGPDNGWRYLADSNTDWGQALKDLAAYQREHNLGPVKLSLFTFLDPATYGVEYEPIAPMTGAPPVLPRRFRPEPGIYAISATTLDGVPLPLPSMYDWFRHREPAARIGHVMFIYQVTESDGKWIAQCTQPVVPLTTEAIAEGFGLPDLRQITYDCEQSWVFPVGGEVAGWYVRSVPGIDRLRWPRESIHLEWWPQWVRHLPLEGLRLSYVQPTPGDLPPFSIWEWTPQPILPPAAPEEGVVVLDDTLAFLGYDAPPAGRPGETIEVLTYWRVLARPARPLSLMLHLTGAGEVPVTVGDGLGVPVDQWQPGDVIVQRHRLVIPPDTASGPYQLSTGAYWLDTLERLNAEGSDIIEVTTLQVQ